MESKFGIPQQTIASICRVFTQYPEVERVIIYGSGAKGTHHEGSDIDIILKGEHLTEEILLKITGDIDELNSPYLFDMAIYETLSSSSLKEHIDRVGQLFYEKQRP